MGPIALLGSIAGPFLALAAGLLLLDAVLLSGPAGGRRRTLGFVGALAACLFVIASYLILTAAFLTDAFSFREVYASSSTSLALLYKLGGPWIGSSGSLLFLAAALALVYGVWRARSFERETPARRAAYRVLDLVLAFFVLATLLQSPFRQLPVTPPDGQGLTPLLQTAWVLVHPPVIFLGYVAVFLAFALLLAGLATRDRDARASARPPLIAAWLLLTVGIALGGLWSYRVLGWGGYWAWDPVETASLLPWLALTAYFHFAGPGRERVRDGLLAVAFFMVVFATVVTRGGFSESVHAYGSSPTGYLFLGFGAAGLLAFAWLRRDGEAGPSMLAVETTSLPSISRAVAAWSLVALLAVCFLGAAAPIAGSLAAGGPFTVGPEFFTLATYPFTLAFVAALIGCHAPMRPGRFAVLIAGALGLGVLLALLGVPTPYALANLGLPLLVTAGGVVAYGAVRGGRAAGPRTWGRELVHLAIVVLLIGVFVSTAGQSESRPLPAAPNSSVEALDLRVALGEFTVSPGAGRVWVPSQSLVGPEHSGLGTEAAILDGGAVRSGPLWIYEYLNFGVVSDPLIVSTPARDLYVSMHQTNSSYSSLVRALAGEAVPPRDVTLVVKTVPLIWLVWLGLLLLVLGMGAVLADELLGARRSRE